MQEVKAQAWAVTDEPCGGGCRRTIRGRNGREKGDPIFLGRERSMPRGQHLCVKCAEGKGFRVVDR
jgi:hypothetical protein